MPLTFLSARQLFSVPLDLLQLDLNSDVTLGLPFLTSTIIPLKVQINKTVN